MKKLLTLCLMLFSLTVLADNLPYPCGTYQQGGKLCPDGNLYPAGNCSINGYYHPKAPQDYWEYLGTINYSPNWFVLRCGNPPEEMPIDDWLPALVVIVACFMMIYLRRLSAKHELD